MNGNDDGYSPFGTTHMSERVAVLIDGPHMYASLRGLGWDADFSKLRRWFTTNSDLRCMRYYNALPDNSETPSPVKPLTDWLSYNGYQVVLKSIRERTNHLTGATRLDRPNLMPEMVTDMMRIANMQKPDRFIIFSGDRELDYPIRYLNDLGVHTTLISVSKRKAKELQIEAADEGDVDEVYHPATVADSLRLVVDKFIELDDIRDLIEKQQRVYTDAAEPIRQSAATKRKLAAVG